MDNAAPTDTPAAAGSAPTPIELIVPRPDQLASGLAALRRGWSPSTVDAERAAREEIERIESDPQRYCRLLDDREAIGGPITLPDGSQVPRLPGLRRWIWDGEFCGIASLRWQRGTGELPAHVLGHAGYSVVPWKQRRGIGTRALGLLLELARHEGLPHLEVTTDADNRASRLVVERNGGRLVECFDKPGAFGGGQALRYRIELERP